MIDSTSSADYSVGRGRPPVHTQFQKGQSGNPSGKAGSAKLVKQRFHQALCAALEGSLEELKDKKPDTAMAALVRRVALDAIEGRVPAQRLLLAALDTGAKEEDLIVSLVQGKGQGSASTGGDESGKPIRTGGSKVANREDTVPGPRDSLVQGKMQGRFERSSGAIASRAQLLGSTAAIVSARPSG